MKQMIFLFLLISNVAVFSQSVEFTETYYHKSVYDHNNKTVQTDWVTEQHTFVFNVGGGNTIQWIKPDGNKVSFTYETFDEGTDEAGYHYKLISTYCEQWSESVSFKYYGSSGQLSMYFEMDGYSYDFSK